jgi:GDP-L-fucose synthase
MVQSDAYRQEYGFNSINLLPVNLYGPRDNFNLESSHVIPALIRKCLEAKRAGAPSVTCWGTGRPTREFLYVEDAAEAVVLAAERYNGSEPVNLGSGSEISTRELAELIKAITGYEGALVWDASRPDGQPRRALDTSRAAAAFDFKARMPFRAGLERTVQWYLEHGGDRS